MYKRNVPGLQTTVRTTSVKKDDRRLYYTNTLHPENVSNSDPGGEMKINSVFPKIDY